MLILLLQISGALLIGLLAWHVMTAAEDAHAAVFRQQYYRHAETRRQDPERRGRALTRG